MLFPLRLLARKLFRGSLAPAVEHRIEYLLPYLYKLALGLVGKAADAEDLVHDTCVKALSNIELAELETDEDLKAWMRIVLINQFRDNYRRAQRSPTHLSRVDIDADTTDSVEFIHSCANSPEDAAIFYDLETAARRAMAALPHEVREVVALYMLGDRSYKEIALLVGCPLGTVMSRLARGRRLLRSALQCYLNADETRTKRPGKTHESNTGTRVAITMDEQ